MYKVTKIFLWIFPIDDITSNRGFISKKALNILRHLLPAFSPFFLSKNCSPGLPDRFRLFSILSKMFNTQSKISEKFLRRSFFLHKRAENLKEKLANLPLQQTRYKIAFILKIGDNLFFDSRFIRSQRFGRSTTA